MSDVLLTAAQVALTRSIGPVREVIASLVFDGLTERGTLRNESRTVIGLSVTNNDSNGWMVEIENEETKEAFSGTITAGETVVIPTEPLPMKWNPDKLGGMWDGLNIRWSDHSELRVSAPRVR